MHTVEVFSKKFYKRDPALVARDMLGKTLIRKLDSRILSGKIVETEAYYGRSDPASRAYKGRKRFNELMFLDAGRFFIYMVHANWLLNIVAHMEASVGAVLIRALEPLEGIEVMKKNRDTKDKRDLTSGPGKLTKALAITNELNGIDVTRTNEQLMLVRGEIESFSIGSSPRIGVKADLPQELRFYIKRNIFVSRYLRTG